MFNLKILNYVRRKNLYFPDGAGNTNGMDPAALMAMMNNGGFGNGSWIWVIFYFSYTVEEETECLVEEME